MSESNNWISTTNQLTNQQLLIAGKTLMKAIYDYDETAPDYLPTSYLPNEHTTKLTNYKHHFEDSNTSMYWTNLENTKGENYAWSCDTNKVLMAELSTKNPSTNDFLCLTDCSGLITGLFAFCNGVGKASTTFANWEKGKDVPTASQYLKAFTDTTNSEFSLIDSTTAVQPGDLIAFGYHNEGHENTGHIMLIAATRKLNDFQTEVVIIDESSSIHTNDTRLVRKDGKAILVNGKHVKIRGIGMGKALLGLALKDETGNVIPFTGAEGQDVQQAFMVFYWGDGVNHTVEYPIAIGRAN